MISFALYAGRRLWLVAGLLGIFGGLGTAGSLLLYAACFHRESLWTHEIAFVQVIGATPAMALLAYLIRRHARMELIGQQNAPTTVRSI
jgi:hypothetical protein